VLHTWGQNLLHHPHLHCLVPGGGISLDGSRWIACRRGFFLSVRVLSRLFRRLFLHYLEKAFVAGQLNFFSSLQPLQERCAFLRHLARVRTVEWVVYAKPPFAGPQQVLGYIGRYTHRIAISNNRLVSIDEGNVRFRWKDYRHGDHHGTMTLTADEFIRRFLIHVLPNGFQRIRYYGFLCNRQRESKLACCRHLLGMPRSEPAQAPCLAEDYRDLYETLTGTSLKLCPVCGHGHMLVIEVLRELTTADASATRHDHQPFPTPLSLRAQPHRANGELLSNGFAQRPAMAPISIKPVYGKGFSHLSQHQ
jgi:hypothetical protein